MDEFSSSEEEATYSKPTEIETKFRAAANYVTKQCSSMEKNLLLELYGLYKQAIFGKCNEPKPSILNFKAKSKWESWNCLGNTSKIEAMQKYIDLIEETDPNFKSISTSSNLEKSKDHWVCHSLPLAPKEDEISDSGKTVFDYVKENNIDKFKKTVIVKEINKLDESGIAVIHWAADRNCFEILEYVLENCKPDVNLKDSNQQTALHYASCCGNLKCAELLLKFGADKDLLDDDGQTSFDVAFDDSLKSFIINFKN